MCCWRVRYSRALSLFRRNVRRTLGLHVTHGRELLPTRALQMEGRQPTLPAPCSNRDPLAAHCVITVKLYLWVAWTFPAICCHLERLDSRHWARRAISPCVPP